MLRAEFGQKHNSWGAAEWQEGAEMYSRSESLTVGLQDEESLVPSVTLLWGTAQDNKPALGRESAAPCACEGSIVSW